MEFQESTRTGARPARLVVPYQRWLLTNAPEVGELIVLPDQPGGDTVHVRGVNGKTAHVPRQWFGTRLYQVMG